MSEAVADVDRVWTLINEIPVAMVVTRQGQGAHMRARPMAMRPTREEGAIYFLTDVDAAKADEVRRDETICLALADNKSQKYVSITGRAEDHRRSGSGQRDLVDLRQGVLARQERSADKNSSRNSRER
jgi:general stress protein 26